MALPPLSSSQFTPSNYMTSEAEAYQTKLHEAVQCLSIGKNQWKNERWAELALHVTQDYLDSVFEHRDEVAKIFRLTPNHQHHNGYYQALAREIPKNVNRVKEKLDSRLLNLGKDRKDPCYFTVVNDYLAFALPVWDLEKIPIATEHIRAIAEKKGVVYIQGKGLWGQCLDENDESWRDIASEQCVNEEDASWETIASEHLADEEKDIASEPRLDEEEGSDIHTEDSLIEEDEPRNDDIIQFVHVYIPKYGLIEFRILHPLAHCLFERDSELKNYYFLDAKRKEERAKIWEFYQTAKEFLLIQANNSFADESHKQELKQKVIDKARALYTDEKGIFRLDMEMRFILNVMLEWPLELQAMSSQNEIRV